MNEAPESWISPELRAALGAAEAAPVALAAGELIVFGREARAKATPFADVGPALAARGFHVIPLRAWGSLFTGKGSAPHPAAQVHISAGRDPADFTGAHQAGKAPAFGNWQRFCATRPTPAQVHEWADPRRRYGVGLACGASALAIDIDFDDRAAVNAVVGALPPTACGKRGARGGTLLYRGHPSLRKAKLTLVRDSVDPVTGEVVTEDFGGIDFLGHGSQTVLPPSIHPGNGWPYSWCGSNETTGDVPLTEIGSAADLPELVPPEVGGWDSVKAAILTALEPLGIREKDRGGKGPKGAGKPGTAATGAFSAATPRRAAAGRPDPIKARSERNLTALREMLAHLPPPSGRDEWLTAGMALHSYFDGGADGLGLWHGYAARNPDKYSARNPDTMPRTWADLGSRESRGLDRRRTMATLLDEARANGWKGMLYDGWSRADSDAYGPSGLPAEERDAALDRLQAAIARLPDACIGLLRERFDADGTRKDAVALLADGAAWIERTPGVLGTWAAALQTTAGGINTPPVSDPDVVRFHDLMGAALHYVRPFDPRDTMRFPCLPVAVDVLNRRQALVMREGSARLAIDWRAGVRWQSPHRDAVPEQSNRLYRVASVDVTPEGKFWSLDWKSPFPAWMKHPARRSYDAETFLPAPWGVDARVVHVDGERRFNTWRGWGAPPLLLPDGREDGSGDRCAMFLQHSLEVVCGGDEGQFEYWLGWLSHMALHPAEKCPVAVVLATPDKGSGKDAIGRYIARMVGESASVGFVGREPMVGRFNADFSHALFLHGEEIVWSNSHGDDSAIKSLISQTRRRHEPKGVDASQRESFSRLFMTSNEAWAAPATANDRRYFIPDIRVHRTGDDAWFDAFHAEMDGDGPAALHAYLRQRGLRGFKPFSRPPVTAALMAQMDQGLRDVDRWWFDVLYDGRAPCEGVFPQGAGIADPNAPTDDADWPAEVPSSSLFAAYQKAAKGSYMMRPDLTRDGFKRAMTRLLGGIEPHKTMTTRNWRFPPLAECRKRFETAQKRPFDWPAADDTNARAPG